MNDRLSVLIVDRNRTTRESLRDLLEVAGYDAEATRPGAPASQALEKVTSPCIVLLDHIDSPRNGLDFVRMAEHEEYLLAIAARIVRGEALEEAEEGVVQPTGAKQKHKSGEYVRVRPVAPPPESGVDVSALVADRRAYQLAAAKQMRQARTAERKVA